MPDVRSCMSCKTNGHASWSRECPAFIRKLNDLNDRNPENALQYIPTANPWTWTASAQTIPQPQQAYPDAARTNHSRDRPQYTKKAPPRRYDSYVPDDVCIPSDSYVPNYDRTGKRVQGMNEGESGIPKDMTQFRPLTQRYKIGCRHYKNHSTGKQKTQKASRFSKSISTNPRRRI